MPLAATAVRTAAEVALVAGTIACLLSLGGVMAYAFVVLVPLHWLAARDRGPAATAAWALLAALSVFEAAWIIGYVATGRAWTGGLLGAALGVLTAAAFLRRRLGRAEPTPT